MLRYRFPNIQFKNLQANGRFEFHFANKRPTAHGYITRFTTNLITGMITFADRYGGRPVQFWLYPTQRTIYFVKQHGNDKLHAVASGQNEVVSRISSTLIFQGVSITKLEIVRQFSKNPCVFGKTYGFDGSKVWVKDGCVASFRIIYTGTLYEPPMNHVMTTVFNNVVTQYLVTHISSERVFPGVTVTGMKVQKHMSAHPCTLGKTYGFTGNRVWVKGGCVANFEIFFTGNFPMNLLVTTTNVINGGTIQVLVARIGRTESFHGITITKLEIEKQFSKKKCKSGETYGFKGNEIWVKNGCEASFKIFYTGKFVPGAGYTTTTETSTSVVGGGTLQVIEIRLSHNQVFPGITITKVDVKHEFSNKVCSFGNTYGFKGNQIWINGGCDATFNIHFTGKFVAPAGGFVTSSSTSTIINGGTLQVIESRLSHNQVFPGITITKVEVKHEFSNKVCSSGKTYGFKGNQIWVNGGCDATFNIHFTGKFIAPAGGVMTSVTSTSTVVHGGSLPGIVSGMHFGGSFPVVGGIHFGDTPKNEPKAKEEIVAQSSENVDDKPKEEVVQKDLKKKNAEPKVEVVKKDLEEKQDKPKDEVKHENETKQDEPTKKAEEKNDEHVAQK